MAQFPTPRQVAELVVAADRTVSYEGGFERRASPKVSSTARRKPWA